MTAGLHSELRPVLPRTMSVSRAARRLGCDARTVLRMLEEGSLRGTRLNPSNPRSWWQVEAASVEERAARMRADLAGQS